MTPLGFQDIVVRLARWDFPESLEGVVGIAQGGVVPAALVAQRLGLGLKVIAINYRDEANNPQRPEPQRCFFSPGASRIRHRRDGWAA